MKPNLCSVRFGDVLANMWWKPPKDGYYFNQGERHRFIISFHGLPSHPFQLNPAPLTDYTDEGFILVYPDYIGTWASYGECTFDNCLDTALETIKFIKNEKGTALWDMSEIKWKVKDITLLGGSFGGSVALTAGGKSKDVQNIISVAGLTDYRTHNREEFGGKEENLVELWERIDRIFKNLWRIRSKEDYDRLCRGEVDLNAVDYTDDLKEKNVFLLHGDSDVTVSVKRSIDLFEKLKNGRGNHKLLILKNELHLGNDLIGRDDVRPKVMKWLNSF